MFWLVCGGVFLALSWGVIVLVTIGGSRLGKDEGGEYGDLGDIRQEHTGL